MKSDEGFLEISDKTILIDCLNENVTPLKYKIIPSLGATETYPFIGSSEIITDITSTGKTLADNNLRVLKDGLILNSTACLFTVKKKAAKLQPFLNSLK